MTPRLPPLADVLDLVPDAVCVVDPEGRFLFVSASFQRIFGYAPAEVLGRQAFEFVHPDDREETVRQADSVMAGTLQRHFRNRYIRKDGQPVDVQWSARWLPEYGVRIAVGHEVSELRRAERELERMATHDALTGLPNRRRLETELDRAIAQAGAAGTGLAVLYIDLDGFKSVNDAVGHVAGDSVLKEVAVRLAHGLRHGDFVARVGGDEFVAILPGCGDHGAAADVAHHLRERLHRLYALGDGLHRLQASIGIAVFPVDGTDAVQLLARADREMYVAKRAARRTANP